MTFTVAFAPEAEEQIATIYRDIAQAASPEVAERYASALIEYCEGLRDFPRLTLKFCHEVISSRPPIP
ncbi:MAG TPA: type II toxin-antitoxin system RelE/ParE family toxin [Steroidobacteraceae bacterium]|nr:type II toxin-antitoxin system RelE/ParE family toxin [Steroidobacteraceae bacterium]